MLTKNGGKSSFISNDYDVDDDDLFKINGKTNKKQSSTEYLIVDPNDPLRSSSSSSKFKSSNSSNNLIGNNNNNSGNLTCSTDNKNLFI